ncbi:MAG: hypothetical protein ACKOYI_11895, partial [Actinomycetota bacterium]
SNANWLQYVEIFSVVAELTAQMFAHDASYRIVRNRSTPTHELPDNANAEIEPLVFSELFKIVCPIAQVSVLYLVLGRPIVP